MFITFEGADGSGKSTQARLLAERLRAAGRDVVLTREPGGAPGAEILRGLLLENPVGWTKLAETLLLFAARAEHVAKTIRPALARGAIVLCDRFTDSTIAYQGAGEGVARDVIDQLIAMIGLRPDWTIMLDMTDDVRRQRIARRGQAMDHYEAKPESFYRQVRKAMHHIAVCEPNRCTLIDGGGSIEDVASTIMTAFDLRCSAV